MQAEGNEKDEIRKTVPVTIPDVPIGIHDFLKGYRRKIMADRNVDFTLMEAYREWLIETTRPHLVA